MCFRIENPYRLSDGVIHVFTEIPSPMDSKIKHIAAIILGAIPFAMVHVALPFFRFTASIGYCLSQREGLFPQRFNRLFPFLSSLTIYSLAFPPSFLPHLAALSCTVFPILFGITQISWTLGNGNKNILKFARVLTAIPGIILAGVIMTAAKIYSLSQQLVWGKNVLYNIAKIESDSSQLIDDAYKRDPNFFINIYNACRNDSDAPQHIYDMSKGNLTFSQRLIKYGSGSAPWIDFKLICNDFTFKWELEHVTSLEQWRKATI